MSDIDRLLSDLTEAGDPSRAAGAKKYLKSDLEHLGVTVPKIRAVIKHWTTLADRSIDDADLLWNRPIFEAKMAAVELTMILEPKLGQGDIDRIEAWLRTSWTWALVDALAVHVAGPLLDRHPDGSQILDRWSVDPDFWIRRSALLAHLKALREGGGDFERFGRYADAMLDEKEFFIRKAIGWILRDTGRKRPDMVYEWILPRASRASGVTIREAVKILTDDQRDEVLEAYRAS